MENQKRITCTALLALALLASFGAMAVAEQLAISDLPYNFRPLVNGRVSPNTSWAYDVVLSNSSQCQVLLNVSGVSVTTDEGGWAHANLNISNLTTVPSHACVYRNGTLDLVHTLNPNAFRHYPSLIDAIRNNAAGWTNSTGTLTSTALNAIIQGDLNVTGNLHVDGNVTATVGNFTGNLYENGNRVCTTANGLCPAGEAGGNITTISCENITGAASNLCTLTDTDLNNYLVECSVSGTTTKTVTCERQGLANLTFSWTDQDTDTTYTAGDGIVLAAGAFNISAPTCNPTTEKSVWNGTAWTCESDAGAGGGMTSWTASNGTTTASVTDGQRVNWTGAGATSVQQNGRDFVISSVDTNSGGTVNQIRVGIGTGNVSALVNDSLLNVSAGAGISLTLLCASGTCNLTVMNTGDTTADTIADDGMIALGSETSGTYDANPDDDALKSQVVNVTSQHDNAGSSDVDVSGTYDALDLQVASGAIGAAELASTAVTPGTYGGGADAVCAAVTIDADGRVTSASNATIRSASTSVSGIVQLEDSNSSTSTSRAPTSNALKSTLDYLQGSKVNTTSAHNNASTSRINVSGAYNSLDLTIPANTITGIDIDESSLGAVPTASALAANGANCAAGQSGGGVDATGAAEDCLDPITETELDSLAELDDQISLTGTADSSTFLRGDGAWATPPAGSGNVTGAGSANTYALWTNGTNIGNGLLSQTSGQVNAAGNLNATGNLTGISLNATGIGANNATGFCLAYGPYGCALRQNSTCTWISSPGGLGEVFACD